LPLLKKDDYNGPQRTELSDRADENETLYRRLLTPGISTNEMLSALRLDTQQVIHVVLKLLTEDHLDVAVHFIKTLPAELLEAVVQNFLRFQLSPDQSAIFASRLGTLALSETAFKLLSLPAASLAALIEVGMRIERIRCQPEVHCRLSDHLIALT
jgi:hypothetical protein